MAVFRAARHLVGLYALCSLTAVLHPIAASAQPSAGRFTVPDGFRVSLYADSLGGPWGLTFGPDSQLYVSLRGDGAVVRLVDEDNDGVVDSIATVAIGLNAPAGIAFLGVDLWVAEASRLTRVMGAASEMPELDTVPAVEFPDGDNLPASLLLEPSALAFYVSVGADCDACDTDDGRRATVLRYDTAERNVRVWARGLRHAAGLALNPATGELWATESGRRGLGADVPTDELNTVHPGRDYGWPYCHGPRVAAPEYADPRRCDRTESPAFMFPARSRPLGIVLYSGDTFPTDFRGDAFIALGGSPAGLVAPQVARLRVREGRPATLERFMTGWGAEAASPGSPVALAVGPDGSLYIADEAAGRVWRVVYHGVAVDRP
jgi:glucose/arabinose dehydrogenase